jgi:RimJ/RimL family protein N-acetyltransferase
MTLHLNEFGQRVGPPLPDWTPRPLPPRTPMQGRFCRLEILDIERHAAALHAAYSLDTDGRNWNYLPFGPFSMLDDYKGFLIERTAGGDPLYHVVIEQETGRAVGVAALMRIDPVNGVIEAGNIRYSSLLQRKPAATEAMYLLMRRVFDELGYRRFEWKCDSLNTASRRAAERYGFVYEGIFRNAMVYRGRSRDTIWLSIIDGEWPAVQRAYLEWLAPQNFDSHGQQRRRLGDLIARERGA